MRFWALTEPGASTISYFLSLFEIKTHLLAPSLGRLEVAAEDTVLPLSVYPFLTCKLNMEGTQTLSARALLGLPWALKSIFALFVYCSPLPRAFHIRSAMVLGWAVALAALIAIFLRDQSTPYFQDRKLVADVAANGLSRDVVTHRFGVSESSQGEDGVL
ncbi:uncharacterized protein KRP23_2752 [Phytophthora ramorum]|uniref:uncharacterized protein n=1 Tax=Phytophthora ramorum TaxID=164328 RepID=UPI0030A535C1|nr:hypothetical protein KRP23_2752 [Phytophthora ramorum]